MEHLISGAPQALFGLAAVLFLALHVFRVDIYWLNVFILGIASLTAAYFTAFAYFYTAGNGVFLNGVLAGRASMLVFTSICFMVVFSLRRRKHGVYFFPSIAAIMFIIASAIQAGNIPALAAAFFSVDLFSILLKKKETDTGEGVLEEAIMNKLFHFMPAAVFLMLFMSSHGEPKLLKLGFNGMVFMLVLSCISGFFTVTSNELPLARQQFINPGALSGFIPVLAQFVIICGMIAQNQGLLLGPFMSAGMIMLLILAAFRSITEEKYQLFAMRDAYILFYLGLLGISCASLNPLDLAVYSVLFTISAANALEALGGPSSAKQTMTGVKYSFGKIQDNIYIFTSMTAGLCAEIYMFTAIYKNLKSDPLIHAILLIGAALYSPAFLNKLFTIFSMAVRIKPARGLKAVFSANSVIMILFLSMAAAMLYKW